MRCGPISGRGSATKVMYAKPPTQPFLTWSGLPAIRPRLDGIFWHFRLRSKLLDSRGELRTFRRILPRPTTQRSKPWPTSVSHVHKCPGTTSAGRRFLRALRLRRVSACSPRQFSNSDLGARASSSNRLARVGGTVSSTLWSLTSRRQDGEPTPRPTLGGLCWSSAREISSRVSRRGPRDDSPFPGTLCGRPRRRRMSISRRQARQCLPGWPPRRRSQCSSRYRRKDVVFLGLHRHLDNRSARCFLTTRCTSPGTSVEKVGTSS